LGWARVGGGAGQLGCDRAWPVVVEPDNTGGMVAVMPAGWSPRLPVTDSTTTRLGASELRHRRLPIPQRRVPCAHPARESDSTTDGGRCPSDESRVRAHPARASNSTTDGGQCVHCQQPPRAAALRHRRWPMRPSSTSPCARRHSTTDDGRCTHAAGPIWAGFPDTHRPTSTGHHAPEAPPAVGWSADSPTVDPW
jgi:hypothetical protein